MLKANDTRSRFEIVLLWQKLFNYSIMTTTKVVKTLININTNGLSQDFNNLDDLQTCNNVLVYLWHKSHTMTLHLGK